MQYLIALLLSLSLSTPVVASPPVKAMGDKTVNTLTTKNDAGVVAASPGVDSKSKNPAKKKHKKYVGIKVPEKATK